MTDLTTLYTLRDKLATATGPERVLDCDLTIATVGDPWFGHKGTIKQPVPSRLTEYVAAYRDCLAADDSIPDDIVPRLTASIDAALALVEQCYPSLVIVMCRTASTGEIQIRDAWDADDYAIDICVGLTKSGKGGLPILRALVEALIAQKETNYEA